MFKNTKFSAFRLNIVIIIIIASVLRFYNLSNNFVFAGDEERQAILVQSIIKDFHIIWIGVNAAHTGFYLGPYWTYFSAFWLYLSQGDPLITGYISSGIGVLTTLLVILVGAAVFNKRVGILSGLLYSTLPLMVFYDQRYWNPSPIPLLSILMFLALYKLKQNPMWAIVFSISFGAVFHTHLSLLPIFLVALFWIIVQKIHLSKTVVFLSLLSFIAMIFPLIAFDYFHKGSNILTPLRFKEISSEEVNRINPSHHFQALFETLGRIWYLKPNSINSDEVIAQCALSSRIDTKKGLALYSKRFNPPLILSIFGSAILLIFLINRKSWQGRSHSLLILFLLSIIISFLLFPGPAFEYYLLGIFPLFLFLPGIFIDYFKNLKTVVIFTVFIISILGINTVLTNKADFGLKVKKNLVQQVLAFLDNQPFELKQTGICHTYEGWRYLFVLAGKTPERSDSDQGLGWLYPEQITSTEAKYTVILSESRVPVPFNTNGAKIVSSGGFTAYIFQNY